VTGHAGAIGVLGMQRFTFASRALCYPDRLGSAALAAGVEA
jgi:hypothetical protein